jgi:intein-encoded DNA endonuclease-like protein
VAKGMNIELAPLDADHVRAKITWSEQDVGGGKLVVEVTVKNRETLPKNEDQLRSDARALAVRFARAFADTIEN